MEVYSFTRKSATWDEPIHLTAGYLAAAKGDYRVDPSHPPFFRMWAALPLLAMDVAAADTAPIDRSQDHVWLQDAYRFSSQFLYRQDADRLLYAARFMVVLWGVALGILLFCWAREWLGFAAAVVALTAYSIEPTITAHSRLVTTDLGVSFFVFGAVYCLWRTCRRPNAWNIAGLTTCFALAFITKFSAVLLLPIVVVLMASALVLRMGITLRASAGIVSLLAAATFAAIWAVYGFRYAPSAADGWLLQLQDTSIVQKGAPALANVVAWVDARGLLPNAFTQGFLMSQASAKQTAYLAGEYSEDGWWYYFPVAFLLKTPAALTLLLLGGAVLIFARRRQFGVANVAFVLAPIVVYLGFAMASGINLGVRHILPIYPFVILTAAAAAKWLMAWRRPIGQLALTGLIVFWGTTFARAYPDMLAFFSVFAGGPGNGLTYLADSNLDWGQDLKPLKAWMVERNVDRVNLAYFGTADPAYYGIESTYLPGTAVFEMVEKPKLPGYVAISATLLSGVYLRPEWRLFYSGFSRLPRAAEIGNSIYVYHVDRWPDVVPRHDRHRSLPAAEVRASLANDLMFGLQWPDEAIQHYRAALDQNPDEATVVGNLGLALAETGRMEDAAAMFQRAATLDPGNGGTRSQLAAALLQIGRTPEAVAQAEAGVRLAPNDPGARDLLGVALAMTGRLADAEASFEKALQIAPGHEDARKHLRQLRGTRGSRLQAARTSAG